MKDYSQVYELLRKHHTVNAKPRLIAEFNHNRYSNPVATNTPLASEDDQDPDLFDIDSIVEGRRPSAGIIKARVGEWMVGEDYEISPSSQRYYIAQPEDTYKYWCSPTPSSGTGFPAGTDIYPTDVNPQVVYTNLVKTNKIVIGLENSFASPANYTIHIKKTLDGEWVKIKDVPTDSLTINSDGQIILYWNGSSWTQTKSIDSYTELAGVQIRVSAMSKPNSFFNLIELGLRLEWDMTSYLMSVSDTFDLGDGSTLQPIGEATSNVAEVEFFNHYDRGFTFSNENPNSLFAGLMEENVKFTLDYIYDVTPVGGTEVAVRQFEMYATQHWSAQSMESVSVSLRDSSKFLQEIKCQSVFYENRTVTGIIFRLLDSVGFNRYDIGKLGKHIVDGEWEQIDVATNPPTIPYFWASPEDTVWDVIQDLASGTQCAIYFDEWDRLQVLTRQQAFANTGGYTWTLRGNTSGDELTDIQEYNLETAETTNDVTVNYQTTEFEEYVSGIRRNSIVWQPEDETVYVKSSDLQKDCLASHTTLWLTPADAALWPFESYMMLEAEMIHYKGKEFTYYPSVSNNPATVLASAKTVYLESYEDYKKYHFDTTPIKNRYLNKFTGRLKITERGMWNTPVQDHKVETLSAWDQKNVRGSLAYSDKNGFYKSKKRLTAYKKKYSTARKRYLKSKTKKNKKAYQVASSQYKAFSALYNKYKNAAVTDGIDVPAEKATIQMKTNANYAGNHYLMALRGNASTDLGYRYYGTRLRFNKDTSLTDQIGGLVIMSNGGTDASGYRAELCLKGGTGGAGRIRIYRNNSNGETTWSVTKSIVVLTDKWYSLDVRVEGTDASGSYIFNVYLDGRLIISTSVSGGNKTNYTGRFGMFARGKSNVSFEYIYAISSYGGRGDWPDNFAKWDRLGKGFSSARFSDFVSDSGSTVVKRKVKKKLKNVRLKYKKFVFDEFGPIAHEIRNFDIKYDSSDMPVLAPYVYWSNTGMVDVYEVVSDAYRSNIFMINTAREDAALQGTDDNHQFCVYGLVLKQRDALTVNTKNKSSIAAVGTKELTVESKWIQNKETAQALADWITDHWGQATDSLSVTIFGNPLITVGDVVTVDIDVANIHEETHRYFVTSVETDFKDGGMGTTLGLRRARN